MFALYAVICCPLTLGNGTVNCELGENGGPNAGDNCTLTCDRGFIMEGSSSRMCDDLGTWTGDDTTCTARMYMCVVCISTSRGILSSIRNHSHKK